MNTERPQMTDEKTSVASMTAVLHSLRQANRSALKGRDISFPSLRADLFDPVKERV